MKKSGENRTKVVIAVTVAMMAVEITAGLFFGSIALLADGLHMASHASALTISALAYYYTRHHARDERFNFGAGKINSLAGFASAVLLAGFALLSVPSAQVYLKQALALQPRLDADRSPTRAALARREAALRRSAS